MLKAERQFFSPINTESERLQTNPHYRKQRRSATNNGKSNAQGSRKTPSPQKEIKILQRRSPTNSIGSPNSGTTGNQTPPSRQSPNRLSPKGRQMSQEKIATYQVQRCLDFRPNQELDTDNYAGARFHSPPTPDVLPKPPTHWMTASCATTMNQMYNAPHLNSITVHLKGLLNVQA